MSDSDWEIGDFVESAGEWQSNGVYVTTGSATATYFSNSAGGRLYLQSNSITMTSTPYSFPLTLEGNEWVRRFAVPAIMQGKVIQEEIRHSDSSLEVYEFGHRVASASIIGGSDAGAHVRGS